MNKNSKLFLITRKDLGPGLQAAQLVHAAMTFQKANDLNDWFDISNTIVLLSVDNEECLNRILTEAEKKGIRSSKFVDDDLGNSVTAIALEPSKASQKLCSNIGLALSGVMTMAEHAEFLQLSRAKYKRDVLSNLSFKELVKLFIKKLF